jgi:hypothetical protein
MCVIKEKAVASPVLLYGCRTWPVALTKEHTKNKALRRTSGPKRMEAETGEWTK